MGWKRIDTFTPPISRPLLVRTMEDNEPMIAFLSPELVWYVGGALVQNSTTLLSATPIEWFERDGAESL